MKGITLQKDGMVNALSSIMQDYKVIAPVKEGEYTFLRELNQENLDSINLKGRPLNSVKQFLYPTEIMMEYSLTPDKVDIKENISKEKTLFFGLKSCDVAAIDFLDSVFQEGFRDIYYINRRENSLIVENICDEILEGCFCDRVGLKKISSNSNGILFKDGDKITLAFSGEGDKLSRLFVPFGDAREVNGPEVNVPTTPEIKDISQLADEEWNDFVSGCLQCGACAQVCPTCHCFSTIDIMKDATTGGRIRFGDACTMESFTTLAMGANSRHDALERIRQRLMHKFIFAPKNNNQIACVGCGRCVEICPAGIDMRKLLFSEEK